jgi:hypothetical protein
MEPAGAAPDAGAQRDPFPPDPADKKRPSGDSTKGGLALAEQYDQRSGSGPKRGMAKAEEPAGQPVTGAQASMPGARARMREVVDVIAVKLYVPHGADWPVGVEALEALNRRTVVVPSRRVKLMGDFITWGVRS